VAVAVVAAGVLETAPVALRGDLNGALGLGLLLVWLWGLKENDPLDVGEALALTDRRCLLEGDSEGEGEGEGEGDTDNCIIEFSVEPWDDEADGAAAWF